MEYLFETKTPPIYEQINIYSTPNFHSINNNNKPVPFLLSASVGEILYYYGSSQSL